MKKLYHKGQIHPSPSSCNQFSLSYLPAAILTLTATLSSDDKQILSYLLSCSSSTPFDFNPSKKYSKKHLNTINKPHPPSFSCYCFSCYTNFWVCWDSSPNRQLIHEIIDAFEDDLVSQRKKKQGLSKREKRKNNGKGLKLDINGDNHDKINVNPNGFCKVNDDVNGFNGSDRVNAELGRVDSVDEVDEIGEKQGSNVRKIVCFIGEKIWGSVWG
ncbi:unnamed protein product [Amaranthus hypochondriacus]